MAPIFLGLYYEFGKYMQFEPTCDVARNLELINMNHEYLVLASSNGFLLCSHQEQEKLLEDNSWTPSVTYYIYNPITQGRFSLPTPKVKPNAPIEDIIAALVCKGNPYLSPPQYYKVVRAIDFPHDDSWLDTLTIEILSSEDDQMQGWKVFKIKCSSIFTIFTLIDPGMISNVTGIVYLPAYPDFINMKLAEYPIFPGLLPFDDKQQEHSSQMILPPKGGFHRCTTNFDCLFGVRRCTCRYGQTNGDIVFLSYSTDGYYLALWVLNEDTKEWGLKYKLSNLKMTSDNYPGIIRHANGQFLILAIHPLDPHILLIQLNEENGDSVWFYVESKMIKLNTNTTPKLPSSSVDYCLPYIWTSWSGSFSLDSKGKRNRHKMITSSKDIQNASISPEHPYCSTKTRSCFFIPKNLVVVKFCFQALRLLLGPSKK